MDSTPSRARWDDLPVELREAVAGVLGSPVVTAVSQVAGFSPGSADRVVAADGRRAFVKTADRRRSPDTADLHRRELAVAEALPASVRAPALLGSWVTDDWVALVLDDVEGRHPGEARDGSDVEAVLDAFATLPVARGSISVEGLPEAADELGGEAAGWDRLEADGALDALPDEVRRDLPELRAAAARAAEAAAGDHLLHLDGRADNVLVDAGGAAWLVDWPWAAVGARWIDGALYLLDVLVRGERVDVEAVLRSHPLLADVPADDVDAVLAAVAGSFFDKARRPAPEGMPTLRAFQHHEGVAAAGWWADRRAARRR